MVHVAALHAAPEYALPEVLKSQIRTALAVVCEALPETALGIHCHDDSGCAVANTLTAGGDTGAHVALPWFLRTQLLAHGQVTGQ